MLRGLNEQGRLSHPLSLLGARFPYSLAWVEDARLAVLVCGQVGETAWSPNARPSLHLVRRIGGQWPRPQVLKR